MEQRIDALGDSVDYLEKLTGNVLSLDSDPRLQELVGQVARILETPIALVSLMLRRTQLFRATYGLPPDLESSKATDRATSFCQLVVRDEKPLLVSHASQDTRLPQDLVNRYGLEAYVGVPVKLGETVIGSMCGLDVVERSFTEQQVTALRGIAELASTRLTELASEQRPSFDLVSRAATPALSDLRSALVVLASAPGTIRCATAELQSIRALMSDGMSDEERLRGIGALADVSYSIEDLLSVATQLTSTSERVRQGLDGMESLLALGPETALASSLRSAARLAKHHTNLLGSVKWPLIPASVHVITANAIVVAVVTAVASELSLAPENQGCGPLIVTEEQSEGVFCLSFTVSHGSAHASSVAAEHVQELLSDEVGLAVAVTEGSLVLRFLLSR